MADMGTATTACETPKSTLFKTGFFPAAGKHC